MMAEEPRHGNSQQLLPIDKGTLDKSIRLTSQSSHSYDKFAPIVDCDAVHAYSPTKSTSPLASLGHSTPTPCNACPQLSC